METKTRLDGKDVDHLNRIREAEQHGFILVTHLLNDREIEIDWRRLQAVQEPSDALDD